MITRSAGSLIAALTIPSSEARKSSSRLDRPVCGFSGPCVSRPMWRSAVWTIFMSVVRPRQQVAGAPAIGEYRTERACSNFLVEPLVNSAHLHHDGHGYRVAQEHRLLLRIERRENRAEMARPTHAGENCGDVVLVIELTRKACPDLRQHLGIDSRGALIHDEQGHIEFAHFPCDRAKAGVARSGRAQKTVRLLDRNDELRRFGPVLAVGSLRVLAP